MIKIERLKNTSTVYDISVNQNNNFFTNDILVHNCQEITLPTEPLTHIDDNENSEGEIALCTLAAINVGEIDKLSELEGICRNAVYALDYVIENQDYPVKGALKMKKRRSLGIGVTNFAYFLAKNGVGYEDKEAVNLTDELFEHFQYYCLKASNELATELGSCEYFNLTKYSEGILPLDTYCKEVDKIITRKPVLDWEGLRANIKKTGLRNSVLTALMPCESSSVVTNSTNGVEPLRALITTKGSKQGVLKTVAPDLNKLKNKYSLAFDMSSNKGLINLYATMQKWIDQSISANHYYNVEKYKDGEIPISEIANDVMYSYKMGLKTLYYANTNDNKEDSFADTSTKKIEPLTAGDCEDGSCTV